MRIDPDNHDVFESSLVALSERNAIELGSDDRVRLATYGDEMVGRLRMNHRGFGFVRPATPTRDGDLHIPRGDTKDAISGDTVRCAVFRRGDRRQRGHGAGEQARRGVTGRIVEVLERGKATFAGKLIQRGHNMLVEPDGRDLKEPVLIRDADVKGAKVGQKVLFEILLYPDEHGIGEGVITEILGEANRPDVETRAVIETFGLRTDFSEAVLNDARKAAASFDGSPQDREDLTDQLVFTIDPPDARDFDDAISLEFDSERCEWTLGIHIADVACFVEAGSALDLEARARGNSAYLPQRVLPMLPETLSNGVCSLQEDVPRYTKSTFITISEDGKVIDQRLSRTLIRSRKRFTYLEAQAVIDGDIPLARRHCKTKPVYGEDLVAALGEADRLAKAIRRRRLKDGMLVLEMPEFELVFDDEGHVVDAQPEDDAFTHTIIEMFMVEANEAVGRTFADLGVPLLRRVHPEPAYHDVSELRDYAKIIGLGLPEDPNRFDIKSLLDATRGSPAARAVHFAVLRTLTKAEYSPALIGHYALASPHYAHFTSPIRRYPDLLVHRVFDAFLDHTDNGRKRIGGKAKRRMRELLDGDSRVLSDELLLEIGRHCSDTEINAEQAERALRTFLVLQFIKEEHLGGEFDAVITHATGGGVIFASLDRLLVEGVAHASELGGSSKREDRWSIDNRSGRLVAQRSGASIGLGDQVRVRIMRVDPAARQLDLAIIEFKDTAPRMAKKRSDGRGRGRLTGPINRKGKGKGKGDRKPRGRKRRNE
jgi:ribonuclease R